MNIDLIGHIFYAFIFIGNKGLASQKLHGWVFRFIGEFGWVGIGLALDLSSIWFWGIIFSLTDLYGFYNWRKNEKASL